MKRLFSTAAFSLVLFACISPAAAADPLIEQAKALFKPIPAAPPALDHNPVTPEKILAGLEEKEKG